MADKTGPILLVDDEPEFVDAFKVQLRRMGYGFVVAATGAEGLSILQKETVSLILSDIMMTPMDGYDFCRAIRRKKEYDRIPILLLSARNDPDTRIMGLEAGADGFLAKPIRLREAKAQIEALLRFKSRMRAGQESAAREPTAAELKGEPKSEAKPESKTESKPAKPGEAQGAKQPLSPRAQAAAKTADEHLVRGIAEYNKGNYDGAIAWLEMVLRHDSGNRDALRYIEACKERFMDWAKRSLHSLDFYAFQRVSKPDAIYYSDLTRDESYVLTLVDGSRTPRSIASVATLGPYKTYRVLSQLFARGVIGLMSPDGAQYAHETPAQFEGEQVE
jgi:CheY-like chemotaxis protein